MNVHSLPIFLSITCSMLTASLLPSDVPLQRTVIAELNTIISFTDALCIEFGIQPDNPLDFAKQYDDFFKQANESGEFIPNVRDYIQKKSFPEADHSSAIAQQHRWHTKIIPVLKSLQNNTPCSDRLVESNLRYAVEVTNARIWNLLINQRAIDARYIADSKIPACIPHLLWCINGNIDQYAGGRWNELRLEWLCEYLAKFGELEQALLAPIPTWHDLKDIALTIKNDDEEVVLKVYVTCPLLYAIAKHNNDALLIMLKLLPADRVETMLDGLITYAGTYKNEEAVIILKSYNVVSLAQMPCLFMPISHLCTTLAQLEHSSFGTKERVKSLLGKLD